MPRKQHVSAYPNGFPEGVSIENVPITISGSNNQFWVDSNAGNSGNKGTKNRPWDQIETAMNSGLLTNGRGDIVFVAAGHNETVDAAADLTMDISGITLVFLGSGEERAAITFGTTNDADMNINAANITMVNPLFKTTIDNLLTPIDVNSADFAIIGGEWRDGASSSTQRQIVADSNADRMRISGWKYLDNTVNTARVSAIQVTGAEDVSLDNISVTGTFSTGPVETTGAVTPDYKFMQNRDMEYLRVEANFFTADSSTWNTTTSHTVAVVTGPVHIKMLPEVTVAIGGAQNTAANAVLGTRNANSAFLNTTVFSSGSVGIYDASDLWLSTTSATNKRPFDESSLLDKMIVDDDIGYTIGSSAFASGTMVFHMWWRPLGPDGLVMPGDGSTMS